MASIGSKSSGPVESARDRVDIVVGLASYNDAGTIGTAARAADQALSRAFGSREARLVLADAGSTDGTPEAARAAATSLVELDCAVASTPELPYHGRPGRARALRAVLQMAHRMGATVCAMVDTRLDTATPDAVERLIEPVLAGGVDYVSPYYTRHLNDGAITKGIVYPMFRALYGVQLRQPAAGEFGCSAPLAAHYLTLDLWEDDRADSAVDLCLAAEAVSAGFRPCEASMGPWPAAWRGAPVDLSTTLAQLVGSLFGDLEHRVEQWQRTRRSTSVPLVGPVFDLAGDPPAPSVAGLVEAFHLGCRELREIWRSVLPPRTIVELRRLSEAPPHRLRFDDRLWATIVYDFAVGYALRVLAHDHLLRSLTPLYSGWLASFILEMGGARVAQVEERIERVCVGFEEEKRYLISRWRWPERLR